ncbi:MAG: sulfur carrier protein ThiS [Desulfobacteraceae bacterium]
MELFVNGESLKTECSNLEQLISSLGFSPDSVVAEVNLKIVKKENLAGTRLKEGDRIELVNFVGGG